MTNIKVISPITCKRCGGTHVLSVIAEVLVGNKIIAFKAVECDDCHEVTTTAIKPRG
jgi:hypothetical protein